ncbi:MAG: HDIG domain-containing protein [Candidatus Omnitrophica bacterium]|nr:HDIG domain-containing protein [Candidatus Omnitrophota bacterium]
MIKQAGKSRLYFIFFGAFGLVYSLAVGLSPVVPAFLILLAAYFAFRKFNLKNCTLLNLAFLYLVVFVASCYLLSKNLDEYYLPFSLAPMLAALLFANMEIVLLLGVACAVSVAVISVNPLETIILFLASGLLAGMLAQGARRRWTVIRAGLITGAAQVIAVVLLEQLKAGLAYKYAAFFLNGLISAIIVLGVLPLFEYLFRSVTNISLLELADSNHPLLQRMVLEAPGTYLHSLVVGNISEAACNAIGANSLLARVGGYYHDIGKLSKPEYFSENQGISVSKHDTLSATMSKLVIMNHVKEGLELAKRYRLSPAIADFIGQHHGNSLVYYFYRRALETLEEDQKIQEEGFRYPGPKPDTKEAAVVLLADSVEAATRALKDPTPSKIQEVVYKVINNKFIDRQLDECDLTLRDMENISAVFLRILSGIYPGRVSYPEETESENNSQKPPKEDSRQSEKDKRVNP